MGRDIGRGNHWDLSLNGTSFSSGDIFSGDSFNRAAPFLFTAGSGGAAVLSHVPVLVGDVLQLQITKTSAPGDYAGVNLTITAVLSGDFNSDNVVDAADYVIWRKTNGTRANYDAWRAHFGQTTGGGSSLNAASIPEPTTFATLTSAIALIIFTRPRKSESA